MTTPPMLPPLGLAYPDPAMMRAYAGFWIRFLTFLLGYFVPVFVALATLLLIVAGVSLGVGDAFFIMVVLASFLLSLHHFPLLYPSVCLGMPGKRLRGVRQIRLDGQTVIFMIGLIRDKTGLHNLIAGTRVACVRAGA